MKQRCTRRNGMTAWTRNIVVASIPVLLVAAGDNTDCRAWRPGTSQNVTVAADIGPLYWGPACNAVLQNISLTVFCYPDASIQIDQWKMQGGYVAIVGPPESPWNISDVAVTVTSSIIVAVEGPAVGVALGYGWPGAAAVGSSSMGAVWAATNVALVSVASTLHSASYGMSVAAASALSVTVAFSGASLASIKLQRVVLEAYRSNVAATGALASAVVGIAMPVVGQLLVSQCSFVVRSSNALAICVGITTNGCASATGGIVVAQASNVTITANTHYVAWSDASGRSGSSSSNYSFGASAVGGVSVAMAGADFAVRNNTHYVVWSDARSSTTSSSGRSSHSASTVGGVSVALADANFAVVNSTQYVAWSNASSSTTTSSTGSDSHGASTVGGVSVALANVAFAVVNSTQYVVWSNASSGSSTSSGSNSHSASTVGGVTVAWANAASMLWNTQYVAWSDASSSSGSSSSGSTTNRYSYSASTVGGVSVALANAASALWNFQYVAWSTSNSNSISISGGSTTNSYSYSASTVGGVSVAPVGQQLSTFLSGSSIQACAYGGTKHVVCANVATSANCCINVTAADDAVIPLLPLEVVTLRLPSIAPLPLPVVMPLAVVPPTPTISRRHNTRSRTTTRSETAALGSLSPTESSTLVLSHSISSSKSTARTASPSNGLTTSSLKTVSTSFTRTHTLARTAPTVSPSASSRGTDSQTWTQSRSFHGSISVATATATPTIQEVRDNPSLVIDAVSTTASSIAVGTAVSSIGSGASGSSAGRISVALALAACREDSPGGVQSPLDRSVHPLGFAIGTAGAEVQYDAGLVLGNTALGVVVTAVHFVATMVKMGVRQSVVAEDETTPLTRAAMWTRFPGLSSAVHLYLLPLIVQSSVACVVHGSAVGVVVGVWGLLLTVCLLVVLVYHCVLKLAECMQCDAAESQAEDGNFLLTPRYEWSARASTPYSTEMLCKCFGAYFEDYSYAARWWLTVEVGTAVASAFCAGLTSQIPCFTLQWMAIVPNAVYVLLVVWTRPHQRWLDLIACTVVGLLLLTSSIAMCFNSSTVAVAATMGASVVGFVPALVAPYKLLQQYRHLRKQKRLIASQVERRRAAQAAAVLQVPDIHGTVDSNTMEAADVYSPLMVDLLEDNAEHATVQGSIGTLLLTNMRVEPPRARGRNTADADLDQLLLDLP